MLVSKKEVIVKLWNDFQNTRMICYNFYHSEYSTSLQLKNLEASFKIFFVGIKPALVRKQNLADNPVI